MKRLAGARRPEHSGRQTFAWERGREELFVVDVVDDVRG
jgi:hypothetical protein